MEIHHGLLDGMQRAVTRGEMLYRHDMGAMQRAQKANAGIDAFISQRAIEQPPDQDRTCAAVTFRTAFLAACQPSGEPKVIKKRVGWSKILQRNGFVVEDETDCVVHALPCFVARQIAGSCLIIYARLRVEIDFRFGNSLFLKWK